jgi:hypothetical protein
VLGDFHILAAKRCSSLATIRLVEMPSSLPVAALVDHRSDEMLVMQRRREMVSRLPPELRYLARPGETYGILQLDDAISDFIDTLTDAQLEELRGINQRMKADKTKIGEFFEKYSMTKHTEARRVYFLSYLLSRLEDEGKL